jgi:hypothetical protein
VLIYRVFPWLTTARRGEPGHPLYVHPDQGAGRWDNPDLYAAFYCAAEAEAAVGESFAHIATWSAAMLTFPLIPGAERALGIYHFDEESHPLLDLDDPRALLDRGLRPTDVVIRNRPATQRVAREVYEEGDWAGISWWSLHRPQWTLFALFGESDVEEREVVDLRHHPATLEAARRLAKALAPGFPHEP